MRLQKEKIQKKTGYENNFVNNNILRSVNDILNSYDDKFVLSAIYEDILNPVIEEAVHRREKEEEKIDQPKVDDFLIKPVTETKKDFQIRDKYYPIPPLVIGDHHVGGASPGDPGKEDVVRQYNSAPTIPLRHTRYGVRMKKGINRLMSSIPKWQSALQLLATSLLVLILPGVVHFG